LIINNLCNWLIIRDIKKPPKNGGYGVVNIRNICQWQ
jgi:hypothetical protein